MSAGRYSEGMFGFLRNHHTVSHSVQSSSLPTSSERELPLLRILAGTGCRCSFSFLIVSVLIGV